MADAHSEADFECTSKGLGSMFGEGLGWISGDDEFEDVGSGALSSFAERETEGKAMGEEGWMILKENFIPVGTGFEETSILIPLREATFTRTAMEAVWGTEALFEADGEDLGSIFWKGLRWGSGDGEVEDVGFGVLSSLAEGQAEGSAGIKKMAGERRLSLKEYSVRVGLGFIPVMEAMFAGMEDSLQNVNARDVG